jgi:hypothetical protein
MPFFFHYQERIHVKDVGEKRLTNVILSFEALEQMYDGFQIEDLLNRVGKWDDNGVWYDEHKKEYNLENRIQRIVCAENLEDYTKRHLFPTMKRVD